MTLLGRVLDLIILLYQWTLAPLLGVRCRFLPTCSGYAREAIAIHGPFRGGWLALRRLSRCHPWGGHGHDPVPPKTLGRAVDGAISDELGRPRGA
jgi:putative membrane protein insertion efficiency factor